MVGPSHPASAFLNRRALCVAAVLLVTLPSASAGSSADPIALAHSVFNVVQGQAGPALDAVAGDGTNTGIGPGAQLAIQGLVPGNTNTCTANFVWKDQAGVLYLGSAGHCFVPSGKRTDGADPWNATGVHVSVCRSKCYFGGNTGGLQVSGDWVALGPVVYARYESGHGNDFGLVAIPPALVADLDPSIPHWGGPMAEANEVAAGDRIVIHGNAVVFGETFATKNREGTFRNYGTETWGAELLIASGDSGAAVGHVAAGADPMRVEAAGFLTNAAGCTVAVAGVAQTMSPVSIGGNNFSCAAIGTTVAHAEAMAKEAGLCLRVVLQGEDPATAPNAADCFATTPPPPPCESDNRNGLKCCEADDEDDAEVSDRACPA
ncbi:MAG TPA: hypothetical protein VM286_08340 [Candidatus Thermoplasmatota archaeon]|nr:hypothetical protein [Candidatus Thermoplasmatota archaeon]